MDAWSELRSYVYDGGFAAAAKKADLANTRKQIAREDERMKKEAEEAAKKAARPPRAPRVGLPTDDKSRKGLPIFRGPLMYFPDALLAVAAVCKAGNDQHNPGQPMHWAREKSTEQMDTALRHMMDHGMGTERDTDGMWHLAKAAWRILAELQLTIEADSNEPRP